jgi:hypothetical protein
MAAGLLLLPAADEEANIIGVIADDLAFKSLSVSASLVS